MPGNSFGQSFRITSYGESHGPSIGVIIDGCPPGIEIDTNFITSELQRRSPGQSRITTQRRESDAFKILSGVFEGRTSGTPLMIEIPNSDQKSADYDHIKDKYRPSHADMTYDQKYGIRDYRGGGRSSARETATRVAAGAVAKLFLKTLNIDIKAGVTQVGTIRYSGALEKLDFSQTENNTVRCPDPNLATRMEDFIMQVKKEGDTVGGMVSCIINGLPAGLGEPVFDKLHADLGKAMLSINAVKGFEYGSGFSAVTMKGSEHNDSWTRDENNRLVTLTNNAGGILGGISNGMPVYFNVAFKPVATLMKDQDSVDSQGQPTKVQGKGRHDPCVVPRAVPIVEAMAALVIADHCIRHKLYT